MNILYNIVLLDTNSIALFARGRAASTLFAGILFFARLFEQVTLFLFCCAGNDIDRSSGAYLGGWLRRTLFTVVMVMMPVGVIGVTNYIEIQKNPPHSLGYILGRSMQYSRPNRCVIVHFRPKKGKCVPLVSNKHSGLSQR